MELIKVTSTWKNSTVYINIYQIGHISDSGENGSTKIGVTTHNNGGFEVIQTIDEVLNLIELAKNRLNTNTNETNK